MLGYRPIIKDKALESRLDKSLHLIDPTQEEIWRIEVVPTNANERPSMQLTETSGNKAWYYGTEEDKILIWQEGMEVPKASEELENYWLEWDRYIDIQR